MSVHARGERALNVLGVVIGGKRNDGNGGGILMIKSSYLLGRFPAVEHGHLNIHEDRIVRTRGHAPESLNDRLAVLGTLDRRASSCQQLNHDHGIDFVILGQQESLALKLVGKRRTKGIGSRLERLPFNLELLDLLRRGKSQRNVGRKR